MLAKSIFNRLGSVLNKFSAGVNYAVLACIYLYENSALFKTNAKIVPICFVRIPIVLDGATLLNAPQGQEPKDGTFKDSCWETQVSCKCTVKMQWWMYVAANFTVSGWENVWKHLSSNYRLCSPSRAVTDFEVPLRNVHLEALSPTLALSPACVMSCPGFSPWACPTPATVSRLWGYSFPFPHLCLSYNAVCNLSRIFPSLVLLQLCFRCSNGLLIHWTQLCQNMLNRMFRVFFHNFKPCN